MRASAVRSVFLTRAARPAEASKRVLVLGGDSIGMNIAERFAIDGFPVLLLGYPAGTQVRDRITLAPDTVLDELQGFTGAFDAILTNSAGRSVERVGFVVAAQPEARVPKFEDYQLPSSRGIVSLSQLEDMLQSGDESLTRRGEWLHVAFLFGLSGESEPAVFSRVLSAIEHLGQGEKVQSYVFTRNLKVAADGLERRYRDCRESGAIFFKFDDAGPVFTSNSGGTLMVFREPLLGLEMELMPDLLVVDERLNPPASLKPLLETTPLAYLSAPFLQPESIRFSGVQTPKAGMFAVGPSRGVFDPAVIEDDVEAVVTALKESVAGVPDVTLPGSPVVDAAKCVMCLTCLRLCPHGAITFAKTAEVDPATCVRCGICAVECPMTAISLAPPAGDPDMISAIRQGLAATSGQGKIVAFLCSRSAAQALKSVPLRDVENLIPIVVRCAGTIAVPHVLEAFQQGAAGVIAAGCFQGNCASGYGTILAEERIALVRELLSDAGIDRDLVRFVPMAGNTPGVLGGAVRELEDRINKDIVKG
ncbi:MAG: hydrogenase iron-sulfur subunit [Desulfomonilaceae bacterium]|nr:hydrogenase iron-sulfur subunit [Desulfomonilaceae bacterium]